LILTWKTLFLKRIPQNTATFMFNKRIRTISAIICSIIFFTKMMISVTPIFSSSLDQNTILQVVLQLEIENNSNNANAQLEDHHDNLTKYFNNNADLIYFTNIFKIIEKKHNYDFDEKVIIAFHPSVPTPPPNC